MSRSDLELVLAWRNNPVVYEHFVDQDGPIRWEDHVRWFENRDPDRLDYVARYDGRRIGVVGVDESDFVSVYVGEPALWGEGLGTRLLNWLTARHGAERDLSAKIHADNERSRHLFKRCGFERFGRDHDWLVYTHVGTQ
jgi:RimJ/RimL family protein N-acetyltransferase